MAVSAITQAVTALGALSTQGQGGDASQNAAASAQQALESSARPQLSAAGRIRSSLEEVQAKAQALRDFSRPPTLNEFKVLVQGFVQSFNNLHRTVTDVAASRLESSSSRANAARTLDELRQAAAGSGAASIAALQKQGLEPQKNGSLNLNQRTFENAFRNDRQGVLDTFEALANRVGRAAGKELSSSGLIGAPPQNLNVGTVSEPQPAKLDIQKTFQQRLASQLANAGGYVARNAVVSYFNVAAL